VAIPSAQPQSLDGLRAVVERRGFGREPRGSEDEADAAAVRPLRNGDRGSEHKFGLPARRFAKKLNEVASLLVRRKESYYHLPRATSLASEFFAYFDQRKVIAEMGA
jgi:hypothetical protein